MIDIGFIQPRETPPQAQAVRQVVGAGPGPAAPRQCPKCGAAGLVRQEGCDVCLSCDYSKCG